MDQVVIGRQLGELLHEARAISADVAEDVDEILREGAEYPPDEAEVRRLLGKIIRILRERGDSEGQSTALALEARLEEFVAEVTRDRTPLAERPRPPGGHVLELEERDGITPGPVRPIPTFHEHDIPMRAGFVRVGDIKLWEGNERLEVHIAQFRQRFGREPHSDEVLKIMLSEMPLPGVTESDQFEIVALARSIANNGVRKPPIIGRDGTLYDGNRRIAACHFILNSEEFTAEQRARVEWIYVWQLTEHSGPDDEERVVVSLNFEKDHKIDWPEYVKARKVYESWQEMLTLEPREPGRQRAAQLKRELSQKFALGPNPTEVNRYIKMMQWAEDFEEHQTLDRGHDIYEVKHQATEYFQYFDELAKGTRKADGVASVLGRDETLKHLVYDLLFQDKFLSWRQIRELRYVGDNSDAIDALKRARDEKDLEEARDLVTNALASARASRAEVRETGANFRIEKFVEWLEQLPLRAFRDTVKPRNIEALLRALKLARAHAVDTLGEDRVEEILNATN
jgi:hypothetical protein